MVNILLKIISKKKEYKIKFLLLRLNTGDIFSMDEEGYLHFRSRSKEIITVRGSGWNFY